MGSILRIDVDSASPFAIPPDNPFVGVDGLDEIYAYGFRNPFKFSFDPAVTNELFVGDVGQDLIEEVDVVVKGGNYGWVVREGSTCFNVDDPMTPLGSCETAGLTDPIAEYDHAEGIAVVGGFVYRGSDFPKLQGQYIFGDFSLDFGPSGRLFYPDADGDRSKIFEFLLGLTNDPLGLFLKGFGRDEDGNIYVLTSTELGPFGTGGQVFRLGPIVGGEQVPGDCNGDATLDLSDAVCALCVLFTGSPATFPCGDGSPTDPGNLNLIDWQPDGAVDISDAIALLQFLCGGGPAHVLAVAGVETSECVPLPGCIANTNCAGGE